MIRTLQRKFVKTAMIAITVLILILLGAINLSNIMMVRTNIDRRLQMIADNEGNPPPPGKPFPSDQWMEHPKNEYDSFLSSNFYVVRFDQNGKVHAVDVSRTSSVTEQEAVDLATQIFQEGREKGRVGKYRFQRRKLSGIGGSLFVFLDCSDDMASYFRVLLLSAAVGLVCWGGMLLFVILLSKKAIRPVAENMEKQKQFVTNAGHEIKTPLAIIQSNTEAMELYQGESKWSRNIKDQTLRLDGLMKNLLLLARMEERTWEVQAGDVAYSELLEEVLQEFISLMEKKRIQVQTDISSGLILHADPGQIRQLITILLDNAVKYTDEDGKIQIVLRREGKQIRLSVSNSCKRLPEVPEEKLFDRFYRADDARTQKNDGYGIGLSIAQAIVTAHHGFISATYIQPDSICFMVCF